MGRIAWPDDPVILGGVWGGGLIWTVVGPVAAVGSLGDAVSMT